jgi:hypothetical protein
MDFLTKNLKGAEPARCVDGRPDPNSPQGPQMLGGSLHPLVVSMILANEKFNTQAIEFKLKILKENNFVIGVHWGAHKHEDKSDCGFADRLRDILQTAKDNQGEILKRLKNIYSVNNIDTQTLKNAYEFISNYGINDIEIIGKELIDFLIKNSAQIENLQGDHGEQATFVNLKSNTTLDTQKLNSQNKQAFNLDLWTAILQTKVLTEKNEDLIRDLSLILYLSTEMVLVEQKGKSPLPIILHK